MDEKEGETETSPGSRIERLFQRVFVERMNGHPFVNPHLRVEAVGFRKWNGHWVGILITPWFLNLIALKGSAEHWTPHSEGASQEWEFPGGTHTFRSDREEGLGEYQSCPVLPSVVHLPDQEHARRAAEAVLRVLFEPPSAALAAPPRSSQGDNPADTETGQGEKSSMARLFSRRSFLRGAMFRD